MADSALMLDSPFNASFRATENPPSGTSLLSNGVLLFKKARN
jgi:hypothetical protein